MKNHYGRTYFDEFMPTCLRGAVFLDTVYSALRSTGSSQRTVESDLRKEKRVYGDGNDLWKRR